MLINCKSCKKKFLLNQREIDLEGSLITCEHCKNEWIYESRTHFLESKLTELDNDLNKKEINLNQQNIKHNEKIILLEKDLKIKNEELNKQRILEERIATFEKRITDTEKLNSLQADLEIHRTKLEEDVKNTSEKILTRNKDIEKKANYLEMKINSYDFEKINNEKNPIAVNDKNNDVVNLSNYEQKERSKTNKTNETNKTKPRYFWPNISDK
jgi:predicted Zn finger-like uncharacterized protein